LGNIRQSGKKDVVMFTPISLETKKQLCGAGKIYISVSSGWEMVPSGNPIPHNIRYRKVSTDIYDDIILYTCYITISTQMVTFDTLRKSLFIVDSFYFSENIMYDLLKLILKEIIIWSKKTGRRYLTITSDLPHITEHFIDLGFLIKKQHNNFVGKKSLRRT
jgi:hypothetical protein